MNRECNRGDISCRVVLSFSPTGDGIAMQNYYKANLVTMALEVAWRVGGDRDRDMLVSGR